MNAPLSLATSQVNRISMLCDFLSHPKLIAAAQSASPVTMPQTVGSMGFDASLWVGLGVVGLWSALDAYLERSAVVASKCTICDRRTCIHGRLVGHHQAALLPLRVLEELEDLRHLFAHNFSGLVDADYTARKRHVLGQAQPVPLSCGVSFTGLWLVLDAAALKHYASRVSETLASLQ